MRRISGRAAFAAFHPGSMADGSPKRATARAPRSGNVSGAPWATRRVALGGSPGLACSPGIRRLYKWVVMTCVGVYLSRSGRGAGNLVRMRRPYRVPASGPVVWYAFRPPVSHCLRCLDHLVQRFGRRHVCAMLGVPTLTVRFWIEGRRIPSAPARRCVWFVWCLAFHPDRLTLEKLPTWGRL